MADASPFGSFDELNAPASQSAAVTPHATNPIQAGAIAVKSLWVGTGGDLVLRLAGDTADRTYKNVPSGTMLYLMATHVRASGTAADIVAHLR